MIENRPETLLANTDYRTLFPPPYALDLGSVPEPVKFSMLTLDGIQPTTKEMADASGGVFSSMPSAGEIEMFRKKGTQFQLIMVVTNCVLAGVRDGHALLRPYSLALIPSSKRGEVTLSDIDLVAALAANPMLGHDTAYVGFDPFKGDWQLWSDVGTAVGPKPREGYMDELGLVTDHYFLATEHDPDDVAMFMPDIPETLRERYFRHRAKLLFTPFKALRSRRIWGVENAMELFVLEEFTGRELHPQPQMLVLQDGSVFPSLVDMWYSVEADSSRGMLTEVDFFFEDARVAVFCDGRHHQRRPQRTRDASIDARLAVLGIKTVRLPAREIFNDLKASVDKVAAALG